MANTSIRKTFSGNGNTKKWTLSWWEKKNKLGTVQRIFSCDESGNNNHDDFFQWQTDDKLVMGFYDSGYYANLTPDRKFRDTNAWYHFVFTWDTAQATASNRVKFYVNGVQETSFATETYPSQNKDSFINTTEPIEMGKRSDNDTQYLESTLSHVHFCDGYAYSASDFGETDSTTGEWKIKTSPSVSYGTNGFWIFKDGNTITDSSPNSNDWSSVSGTLTKTEDCPSNVFCNLNPLAIPTSGGANTFSNGNLTITNSADAFRTTFGTLGANSGKWYWEAKFLSGEMKQMIGISKPQETMDFVGQSAGSWSWQNENYRKYNNNSYSSYGSTASSGDIIMVAFDADNGTIWIGKNGTWFNSATQTEIQNGTTTNAMFSSITIDDFFLPAFTTEDSNIEVNFGNGYFGTTAVSSAGTNASGNGIFEYDVPTGYTALSTKGLNL